MATISFSEATYTVAEGEEITVRIVREGDTEISAIVLVASDNFVGTAQGSTHEHVNSTSNYTVSYFCVERHLCTDLFGFMT